MNTLQTLLEVANNERESETAEMVDELRDLGRRLSKLIKLHKEHNVTESLDNFELPTSLIEAIKRFEAAKRGLGITNKLRDPGKRAMHRSRVMTIINKLRASVQRLEKEWHGRMAA